MPLDDGVHRVRATRRSPPPRSARSTARRPPTAAPSRSRSSTRASPRRSRPTCATCRCCFPLVKRLAPGLDVKALGPGAARADRRRARLRGRGPEPPRDGARLARPPVRLRPAGRHRALAPPRARHRAARRPPLRGGQAARRGRARPLRRDRLPLLLRHAQAPPPRRRRPAPRQLPAARRRPRRLPRLRPDAGRRRRLPRGRARARAGRRPPATRTAVHAHLAALGYLPEPDSVRPRSACSTSSRPPASGTSSPASAASPPPT